VRRDGDAGRRRRRDERFAGTLGDLAVVDVGSGQPAQLVATGVTGWMLAPDRASVAYHAGGSLYAVGL
jgi:hypothetical protein